MKVIDITEKLNFEEKPKIKIKDTEITINNSASVILQAVSIFNKENSEPDDILKVASLLIPESEKEKLDKLDLSFEDFVIFIEAAVSLATSTEDDEGEAPTHTTT